MNKQLHPNDTKPTPQAAEKQPPRTDHTKAKPIQFEGELPGEFGHQILEI